MKSLCLKIAYYACEKTDNEKSSKNNIIHKIWYNGLKLLCVIFLELYIKMKYLFGYHVKSLNPNYGPVVSMTSFPARINKLWFVIDSIFSQTIKPSKIILVLTNEEFPNGINSIPNNLKQFIQYGLEIVFVDYNLRPHNKYYYALSHISDRDVVTLDDDLYYWPDTIKRLYDLKDKSPYCIYSNRVLKITYSTEKVIYSNVHNIKGLNIMAQGVGGVLYPHFFRPQGLFDKNDICDYCICNDDNWLRMHETIQKVDVVSGNNYPHPLKLLNSQKITLAQKNTGEERSNKVSKMLIEHYNLQEYFKG